MNEVEQMNDAYYKKALEIAREKGNGCTIAWTLNFMHEWEDTTNKLKRMFARAKRVKRGVSGD